MTLLKYEIVVLFKSSTSWTNIDELKKKFESVILQFWWKILEIDDIGYIKDCTINWNPYYYSLYTNLEWTTIKDLKRKLSIIWNIDRINIFKMKDSQKFLKFKEIEKKLIDIDFSNIWKNNIFDEIDKK